MCIHLSNTRCRNCTLLSPFESQPVAPQIHANIFQHTFNPVFHMVPGSLISRLFLYPADFNIVQISTITLKRLTKIGKWKWGEFFNTDKIDSPYQFTGFAFFDQFVV